MKTKGDRKDMKKFGLLALCIIIVIGVLVPAKLHVHAASSQTYTWKNVVTGGGGGYIPGIIFNTKQKDLIFARTDMGGAYKWNPSNGTWTQLLAWVSPDDWNWTGCESIATDPVDPNRLYLAVGTYTNDWASTNGAILRSTDQGITFSRTDLPFKNGSNMPGRNMGERLVIDPNKNSILYFGARSGNGLWKSTDYGVTWSKVSSFPDAGNYVQDPSQPYLADKPGVVWVTFDPRTGTAGNATQTIYVGVASKGTCIYRSTDGGATWAAVPGQPTSNGYLPHHGILGSNGILYVTYSDTQGPYDGAKGDVYKYDTATGVWTMISPIPSTSGDDYFGYGGLAVDAQNPNTIMVSSLNSWWPDAIIFRSTDAGATWTRIWDWASYPSRTLRYTIDISNAPWLNFGVTAPVDPVPAVKIGWMIGDLDIDPFNSDRMFYGTGATIYGITNLTAWDTGGKIAIKSMALGVEETSVLGLISPPSGANLYSALGDIGGARHDDLTKSPAKMWSIPYAGTFHCIDYAELNPQFMCIAGKGDPSASPATKSTGFTYDGGTSWFAGNSDIGGITAGGTIAAAADASAVVWAPEGGMPSYSTDNGNSWITCNGLQSGAFVCSDRANASKFYAFLNGTFYTSTDKGKTFTPKATGLPTSGKIKAVPGREGDIWLCGGTGGLYHSIDSGATFTKLSNVQAATVIGYGKAATGQTYMALYLSGKIDNVSGIYRSDDAGASWVMITDSQHQFATHQCITGDPRIYGRVYVGTNGFGINYGDPSGPTPPPGTATPTPVRTPTPVVTATPVRTATPRITVTPTPVRTATPRVTVTATPVRTATPVITPVRTVTPQPATPTPVPPTGSIKVQFYNQNTAATSNQIYLNMKVVNTGSSAVALSNVTIRYYYTIDGAQPQNFWCDYSPAGSSNVTGTFVTMSPAKTGADTYVEVGFTSGAGTLAANGGNTTVQARVAKSNWTNYNQADDYSFNSAASTFVDWTQVTGYVSGTLQWGIEP
jgi:xyloglucan-specific exo-beta-1,4-glucanase